MDFSVTGKAGNGYMTPLHRPAALAREMYKDEQQKKQFSDYYKAQDYSKPVTAVCLPH